MSVITRLFTQLVALTVVAATIALGTSSPATAADTGAIEITVRTSDGGDVAGVLSLYRWADGFSEVAIADLDGTTPTRYTFSDLAPGSYYASFQDAGDAYAVGYSEPATALPTTLTSPGVVEIAETGVASASIALKPQAAKKPVTGSIVTASGAGISDVYIVATLVTPNGGRKYADDAVTNANGDYRLDLRPGTVAKPATFVLDVEDIHQRYGNVAPQVTVVPTTTSFAPITLAALQQWTYTGTVNSDDGQPVAGARVQIYSLNGVVNDFWSADPGPVTTTDANGKYTFTNLKHNAYYTVGASAYRHPERFLGGGTIVYKGTSRRATANLTMPLLSLPTTSGLQGTVRSPLGTAEDVNVQVHRWDAAAGEFEVVETVKTAANGSYRVDALDEGSYAIRFDASTAPDQLRSVWLGGSTPTGPGSANVFTVDATATDIVKNADLAPRQLANGTMTTDTGEALAGGTVTSFAYNGETNAWTPYATVDTTAGGAFAVAVPATSTVTFRFTHAGYLTRYLDGDDLLPATPTQQNSKETAADGDLALGIAELAPPTHFATGTVTDGRKALAGATVTSYRWRDNTWKPYDVATTAANGSFNVGMAGNSDVTFGFARAGYTTRYYGGGSKLPGAPTGSNSVDTRTTDSVQLNEQLAFIKLGSTTAAKLARKKIRQGKSTKVTITVKVAGGGSPTGTVQVYDGRKRIKTVTLTSASRGTVVVKIAKPKKGKHKISAKYLGASTVNASTSTTVILKVIKKRKR